MSGWDDGQVFVSNQGTVAFHSGGENNFNYKQKFIEFIRNYREDNSFPYRYKKNNNFLMLIRDQLRQNCVLQNFSLKVNLDHLAIFEKKLDLASKIKDNPTEFLPLVLICSICIERI
jgi:hypothetical protein